MLYPNYFLNLPDGGPKKKVDIGGKTYELNDTPRLGNSIGGPFYTVTNQEDFDTLNNSGIKNIFLLEPSKAVTRTPIDSVKIVEPQAEAARQLELAKAEAERLKEQGQVEALRRRQQFANEDLAAYRKAMILNAIGPGLFAAFSGAKVDTNQEQYKQMYINAFNKARALGADVASADAIAKQNAEASKQLAEKAANIAYQNIVTPQKAQDYINNQNVDYQNRLAEEAARDKNTAASNAMSQFGVTQGNEVAKFNEQKLNDAAQRGYYSNLGNYYSGGGRYGSVLNWDIAKYGAEQALNKLFSDVKNFNATKSSVANSFTGQGRDQQMLESLYRNNVNALLGAKDTMDKVYSDQVSAIKQSNVPGAEQYLQKLSNEHETLGRIFDYLLDSKNIKSSGQFLEFLDTKLPEIEKELGAAPDLSIKGDSTTVPNGLSDTPSPKFKTPEERNKILSTPLKFDDF